MGVKDFLAFLTCCTCCRMIIRGWGDVLTSLTSTSLALRNMYTLRMLSYDHHGGGGCVLTSLTSTSLTSRNMYTLHMLSYDHQGGVLTSLTSTSLTLRNTLPLLTCCRCFLMRFCWISCTNLFWYQGLSPQKIQDGPSQPQTKYLY